MAGMALKLKLPSLTFNLRTLFLLVAMCACWTSYSLSWIRQRKAALDDLASDRVPLYYEPREDAELCVSAPSLLGIFGERGYSLVSLECWEISPGKISASDQAEVDRLAALFPEAKVEAFLCGLIGRTSDDQ
jgi:hypothetical protein